MKRKKLLKLSILLALLTPTIINAKEYIICGNEKKFPTIIGKMISIVYVIIKILVPLLLVITGALAFFKVTFSNNVDESLDKAKKKFITNMISAIIIFFIASIINFVIGLAAGEKENSFSDCIYCMLHPEECRQQNGEVAIICPGLLSEQYKYNSDCTLKEEYKNGVIKNYSNTGDTKIPARSNTIARIGGGAIARTLTDNPYAANENIITKKDSQSKYNYYVYIPKKVDDPNSLPLIVYLHGNGTECGSGYQKMIDGFGFPKYINKGMEFNTYILMPQKPNTNSWSVPAIKRIIDETVKEYNIDKNRISIWGYSQGAEDLPDIVNASPNTFASAVILAKGFDDGISGFKGVSTYGFYGTADKYSRTVTPNFIAKLQNAGQTAYIKAYEGVDHDNVMEELMVDQNIGNGFTNIMDWVLDQRRTD